MEQLDPQVVTLSKAIRQTESGGNFNAKGKSGEYGAYQYTEPTWNSAASKYGINTKLHDATPEQQNEITYRRIKEWKDKGFNPGQIASMWNAGEGEPNAYTGQFSNGVSSKGKNKFGVGFDVPAYAKSVAKAYQTLKSGGQVSIDPANPSSVPTRQTFTEQLKEKGVTDTQNTQQDPHTGVFGENQNDSLYGKLIDNSITRGIQKIGSTLTGGGTDTLGATLGTMGGAIVAKNKDITTGSNDFENYDLNAPSPLKTGLAGIKTVASASGLKMLGGLFNPLNDAAIIERLPVNMSKETFLNLGKTEKLNQLGDMLNTANKTGALGDVEKIAKAIKSLNPGSGFISKILKNGYSLAKQALLAKLLGDQLGHFIHRNTE